MTRPSEAGPLKVLEELEAERARKLMETAKLLRRARNYTILAIIFTCISAGLTILKMCTSREKAADRPAPPVISSTPVLTDHSAS